MSIWLTACRRHGYCFRPPPSSSYFLSLFNPFLLRRELLYTHTGTVVIVRIFSEFCASSHFCEATTAKRIMKIDPHCQRRASIDGVGFFLNLIWVIWRHSFKMAAMNRHESASSWSIVHSYMFSYSLYTASFRWNIRDTLMLMLCR